MVTGSLLPLGSIFSTSVWGRGMTCTDTSSPTRRADVAGYHHGHVAGADVFLAHKDDVGRLHHRIGRLDRPNETFGLDHSQGFEWHAKNANRLRVVAVWAPCRSAVADTGASSHGPECAKRVWRMGIEG